MSTILGEDQTSALDIRLAKYSLVAGTVLAITNVNATVVHTDPADQSGTSQTFSINFDGDGDTEVVIKFGPQSGVAASDIRVAGTTGMHLLANYSPYGSFNWYGRALNASVTIGPLTTGGAVTGFDNGGGAKVLVYSSQGQWVNTSQKYLGVQFKIGGNTHYGWVRMTISGSRNFNETLYDYAYETTPNLGIKAGSLSSLPVELTSFTAVQFENAVKLLWETASEVNNYGFEVERQLTVNSDQSSEWQTIGFVEGHGNSNSPKAYEFIDETAPADNLEYRLKQIDTDGKYEYYSLTAKVDNNITDIENNSLPLEFALEQNYPNPFNPETVISYQLAVNSKVQLKIYDLVGKEVATLVNKEQAAGNYSVNFEASNLPSGMYIYKLTAGNFVESKKMMLMK